MIRTTRVGLLAGATALTLTGASYGNPAGEATNDDLAQRLAAAEAKIASMEAAQNQNWLTEQRASEIRGLVQDVLSDSDSRASLLQGGMTSGYDNGFVLGDSAGNWLLRTNFLMQQRFNWNHTEDDVQDSDRWGFENTRSKFIMSGHVVNPDWYYLVDVNLGSGTGRTGTLNAYLGHNYGDGWKIQMGSMKAPLLREELVESQYQLLVERSLTNYLFTAGYADGLLVNYKADQFQVFAMLSDGANTGQTSWSTFDTEYALTGRGEFLVSGNWDQFRDFTSSRDGETGILLGGAAHFQKGESGNAAPETEIFLLTVDASAEFAGLNLFGSFVYSDVDSGIPGAVDGNPWGLVFQGGFYLTDAWEVFGRYEMTDFDSSGIEDLSAITLGVNYYFAGHNAKWTTDIGFGLDPVTTAADITAWRPDIGDEDGQIVFRTQWQILF
jgi:hypothetical protein